MRGPRLQWAFYTYFSQLPVDGFEIFIRSLRGFAAAPTNDGLTMLGLTWPYAEAHSYKADVEGNFFGTLQLASQFAARVRSARREAPFLGRCPAQLFAYTFWLRLGAGR